MQQIHHPLLTFYKDNAPTFRGPGEAMTLQRRHRGLLPAILAQNDHYECYFHLAQLFVQQEDVPYI